MIYENLEKWTCWPLRVAWKNWQNIQTLIIKTQIFPTNEVILIFLLDREDFMLVLDWRDFLLLPRNSCVSRYSRFSTANPFWQPNPSSISWNSRKESREQEVKISRHFSRLFICKFCHLCKLIIFDSELYAIIRDRIPATGVSHSILFCVWLFNRLTILFISNSDFVSLTRNLLNKNIRNLSFLLDPPENHRRTPKRYNTKLVKFPSSIIW